MPVAVVQMSPVVYVQPWSLLGFRLIWGIFQGTTMPSIRLDEWGCWLDKYIIGSRRVVHGSTWGVGSGAAVVIGSGDVFLGRRWLYTRAGVGKVCILVRPW